jgi:hypothetical protein
MSAKDTMSCSLTRWSPHRIAGTPEESGKPLGSRRATAFVIQNLGGRMAMSIRIGVDLQPLALPLRNITLMEGKLSPESLPDSAI